MASPRNRRPVTVSFHVIEPDSVKETWSGLYPWDEVLDSIEQLDLETGEYHLQRDLFGTSTFCTVFDGPLRLLAGYTKDELTALLTELKGVIEEVPLRIGEGFIDGTYVAAFPSNVVGIVRSSVKAPGAASISHWLSEFTEYPCHMPPLPKASALAGLNRPSDDINNVFFRVRRHVIPRVRAVRPDVAKVLAEAGKSGSSKVGIEYSVETRKERAAWWPEMRAAIADLEAANLLAEFDAARVQLSYGETVNLKTAYVTDRAYVDVTAKRRFNHEIAGMALAEAYSRAEQDILEGVAARGETDADSPGEGRSDVDQPSLG
jgi:hypothetical protein